MYSFVLEWTPALEVSSFEDDGEGSFDFVEEKLPHGTVFSSFMVSIMMGTWFYSKWINQPSHGPIERLLLFILMVSTARLKLKTENTYHYVKDCLSPS